MAIHLRVNMCVFFLALLMFGTGDTSSIYQVVRNRDSSQTDDSGSELPHSSYMSADSQRTKKTGYILTLRYNGQQSAGIRSMLSQQCWVGSYNLPSFIVEPFLQDSYVEALPNQTLEYSLRVSDFFDLEHLSRATKHLGYAQLASWTEFLRNAPRNVVYIQTKNAIHWELNHTEVPKVIWNASTNKECYAPTQPSYNARIVSLVHDYGFCIVRVVRVHTSDIVPFSNKQFHNHVLQELKLEDVTLVFDKWFGAWHVPPTLGSPSVCEESHETSLQGNLRPSQLLRDHAVKYEELHAERRPFKVAVMLRSEHLLHTLPPSSMHQNLSACFDEAIRVTRSLLDGRDDAGHPFLTLDIGRYGSASFQQYRFTYTDLDRVTFYHLVKRTFKEIVQRKVKFSEWQDSFSATTDGMEDRGYIAALQRTIASRADCLVLVGGGQFLKVALHEYLDLHSRDEWCIWFVCVFGRYEEEYQEILQTAQLTHVIPGSKDEY